MRKRLIALSLLLLAPISAHTQEAAVPPLEEAAVAARVRSEAIIAAAHAADLFVVDPGEGEMARFPKIRHVRSGLICTFNANDTTGAITLFPTLARGDDVACNMSSVFDTRTLYATRATDGATLDQQFEGAVQIMRMRFPDIRPFERGDSPGLPALQALPQASVESRSGSFVAGGNFTHVSVAIVNGWVIKMRLTGPAGMGDMIYDRAAMAWRLLVRDVVAAQAADPENSL